MQGPTDFYDDLDNFQQFYSLGRLFAVPSFVKESTADKDQIKDLPSDAFADPQLRKFPLHSKAATWLAQAYFQHSKGYYDTKKASLIQDRITKAAEFFQISALCKGFTDQWKKVAGDSREDLPDSSFGLVVDYNGAKQRLFPMPNIASVKMAGEYLFANRFKYPYEWRKQAARNILKAALEWDKKAAAGEAVPHGFGSLQFDPDTQSYLEKASGFAGATPQHVAEKIAQRVVMMGDSHRDLKVKLAEMSLAISKMPGTGLMEPEMIQKAASIVDLADRETGLHRYYNQGLNLPEEDFFQFLKKEAQAILDGHVTLSTGNTYPVEAFQYLPLDKVAEVMGDEFKNEVTGIDGRVSAQKVAEIAPTLPRDEAVLFETVLENVASEAMKKSADRKDTGVDGDPYSQESMISYFQKKGMKPRNLRYTLAIPVKKEVE